MRHVFIVGPFRGSNAWDVARNVHAARCVAFQVAQLGAVPVCPHTMYSQFDGTLTDDQWLEYTQSLLRRCDALMLCPRWEQSVGTRDEISLAGELSIPVFGYDAHFDDLSVWLRGEASLEPTVE